MGSVCLAGRLQASSSPDGADQALTAGARIGVKGQTSEQGDGARGIPLPLLWLAGSSYTDLGVKASCLCQTECPSPSTAPHLQAQLCCPCCGTCLALRWAKPSRESEAEPSGQLCASAPAFLPVRQSQQDRQPKTA